MENRNILGNGRLALGLGMSSVFGGLLGVIISTVDIFTQPRSRATAVTGLVLSLLGMCLFFFFLAAIGRG